MLFQEPLFPFHHMLKMSEIEVVYKVGFMKVSRVYSVESGAYVAVYFHRNLGKIVGDMGVLSLLVLPRLLRIMGVVAWLIYVSRILTKFCGHSLTLRA